MNQKNILLSLCTSVIVLLACNNETKTAADTAISPASTDTALQKDSIVAAAPATASNSADAADWAGIYKGTLPCADCEGIETTINIVKDSAYSIITKYLGKKNAGTNEKKGKLSWNKASSIITLEGISNAPNRYLVSENMLEQLDMQGKRIKGDNAVLYQLIKQVQVAKANIVAAVAATEDATLTDTYWKLTELAGKPVSAGNSNKEMFVKLISKDNRVSGNGGCNGFFGAYETKNNYRIKFSKMGSTMMACPGLELEKDFLNVFERADSYIIRENKLQLVKARMAPLAVFEAVEGK